MLAELHERLPYTLDYRERRRNRKKRLKETKERGKRLKYNKICIET